MNYKKIGNTYVLRAEPGEEIVESLMELAKEEDIKVGIISGIGACGEADIGHYSVDLQEYKGIEIREEVEMLGINGNITEMNGEKYLHVHGIFGKRDGSVVGGHLKRGVISATSEIFIRTLDGELDRVVDEKTGINVLDI